MRLPECIVIDFETEAIRRRPDYPPRPVGCAVLWPRAKPFYMAWGHPTGNNCREQDALLELNRIWDSGLPVLCHHAKFDLAVAYEQLGGPRLPWQRVHDTMFLAYLCDPHARKLGLKELAADLLQIPAVEQSELSEWILAHKSQLEQAYLGKVSKGNTGEWIWATPGNVCAPYAVGDVVRTAALFAHLWPIVQREGMGEAYDRERQLMPILMENEEIGLRIAKGTLSRDIEAYNQHLNAAEEWLRVELKASGLNFDADQDVASILMSRGIVPEKNWQRTKSTKSHPNGQLSVSKETLLPEHFTDPRVASVLGYRNRLKTCLTMFMRPWYEQASQRSGYISTSWNQVRGDRGGTRTGRPSTQDPNWLNISKDFEGRDDGYVHPAFLNVAKLPLVRKYVLPDVEEVFLHRDFDGQELRLFAHFEKGELWEKYQANHALDPHAFVGEELMRVAGRPIERTKVKVLNFQSIYGGGVPALQKKLRCTVAEAKQLKEFHNAALPGRKILNEEITRIVRRGEPIRTVGGRLYYPEPAGADGRDKIYKLINYLIQGSAADTTKQAIIDWHKYANNGRFLVTVYDEINISAPAKWAHESMGWLKEAMEQPRLGITVPMTSSGKSGLTWGDLAKCP